MEDDTTTRNAAHAAVVRGWLDEALSFGALEMAAGELDAIVSGCDRAGIEFSDFAGLDALILETGEEEQKRRASRKRLRPDMGCDEALDGEQGSVVDLDEMEPAAAAAVAIVVGKYFALFERPLLALGAFRAARALGNTSEASCGMAGCLLELGQRAAAAALTKRFWQARALRSNGEGGRHSEDADGVFAFLLADVLDEEGALDDDETRAAQGANRTHEIHEPDESSGAPLECAAMKPLAMTPLAMKPLDCEALEALDWLVAVAPQLRTG